MMTNLKKNSVSSSESDLAFKICELPESNIYSLLKDYKFIKDNKKIEYLNVACSFDIESTSITDECKNKIAFMYAFTLNINGRHIEGRTWDTFIKYLDIIREYYALNDKRRMILYIHNLAYEFQFIKCRFKWDKIFALKSREVVKAITGGIEFRCSYVLSGYKLATLGDKLHKYKVAKMVGDLDYSKIRHSNTYLSDTEWKYIYHDGLVVVAWITERIEEEKNNITNIPLTKTGYVRRYCRNKCLYDGSHNKNTSKYLKYRKIINSLTITSKEEYFQLKRAYIGAHTHGNPLAVGEILHDVYSVDFTSSYPYVMLSEDGFPMSKAHKIKITSKEMFYDYIKNYCCIFDITFINIESLYSFEHVIPISKCYAKSNALCDNGKLVKADMISMSLNEVDFDIFSHFYKWDEIRINNFRYYYRGYLPKDFILSILHLYKDKTELKGVEGKELDYLKGKENLNSAYGMCVTDVCRDEIIYDEEMDLWTKEEPDYDACLTKYNKSKNRFLFYHWGLYVTSFAKRNLLVSGVLELKYDYLYSDTDSLKFLNYKNHKKYFEEYNKNVEKKLLKMCNHYKINPALIKPKNNKGEEKLIGIWDTEFEGDNPTYLKFKYLGSKRYAYMYPDNTYSFTVAGCSKTTAIPYLMIGLCQDIKTHKFNFELLDKFDDNMYIPADYTGKNCHTYFDYEVEGEIVDYLGKNGKYHEFSGVNISPIDFTLSLTNQFIDYILGLRGVL